ncbi:cAMP-binding domain of CRP or a regulatory subunit of cAMP-dependent protein kinases [Dyadobacter soli]|uniref:cAMP-binding domain of CRP or a regulatory subunit of cAMP-dependent protein kinases n=1 Tax=Dyadobacter soli TaxID=659014 RepID=A0A1G7M182_9BACT|nr:Crp/Fnr family transcriptional regulator [Dyadobacter soli]SDF55384.1 cAMP-binding domain of CRP or a regulatory subunit of cAMP-dependent protein kinases [Dyadobacter soli]
MDNPITKTIEKIRSIVPLSDADIELTLPLFQPWHLRKGDYFVQEGQVCHQVGFIQTGLVRYFVNQDGDEKIYSFGLENDFVCDYESFLSQQPSRRAVQAIEDSTLYVISSANLQRLFAELTYGERFGRIVIEQIFVQTIGQLVSLYTDSPEARYKAFLDEYPSLATRVTQYHIASYVGVKPQSLSRIRARWAGKDYTRISSSE